VRETEQLVARTIEDKPKNSPTKLSADPDIRRLETNLSEKVGAAVKIVQSSKGKGKLLIKYNSLDELDGILAHILQE
jgi:ParB family transcriptional regulator, chromosome partitioning protein